MPIENPKKYFSDTESLMTEEDYAEIEASLKYKDKELEKKVAESENKVLAEIEKIEQQPQEKYKILFKELQKLREEGASFELIEQKKKEWKRAYDEAFENPQNQTQKINKFGDGIFKATDEPIREQGYTKEYLADLTEAELKQLLGEMEKKGDDKNYLVVEQVLGEKNSHFSNEKRLNQLRYLGAEELVQRKNQLEDELETIQEDNHPRLTDIDDEIEAINKQLEENESKKSSPLPKNESFGESLEDITKDLEEGMARTWKAQEDSGYDNLSEKVDDTKDPWESWTERNPIDTPSEQIPAGKFKTKEKINSTDFTPEVNLDTPSTDESTEISQNISDAIAEKLKKNLDKKKINNEKPMHNILEQRRFGHKKQLFEEFAQGNEKLRKNYEQLQGIFAKKFEELSNDEQKLVRSIDFKKFINEKKLNKEQREKVTLKKEAVEILDKRIRSLENEILKQEGKNVFQRGWKQFKSWYEKPDNKRKLHKRILVSGAVTAGLAFTGVGVLGLVGANVARFAGSYAGGETARWIYDRSKKDYRQKMADFRRDFEKNPGELKEKANIKESVYNNYKQRRNELLASSAGYIQNKNKWRERWDTIGRILGGVSVRGAEELFAENLEEVIPESVPETEIDIPAPQEPEITPIIEDNEPTGISKDAYINKGEGITHALLRQLRANPDLREAFGIEGNATGADAARVAREFGYINNDGSEVRVFMGEGAAYELTLDDNGNPIVREHKGGHINGDFYEGGQKVERHLTGNSFEGDNIEKQYEYLYGRNSGEQIASSGKYFGETNISHTAVDLEGSVDVPKENFSHSRLMSSEVFPGRNYPGHIYLQPGTFGPSFNNILGDKAVKELFEQHNVAFTQENFEKLGFRYDENSPLGKHFTNIYDNEKTHYSWKDIYERFDIESAKKQYLETNISHTAVDLEGAVDVPQEITGQNVEIVRKNIVGPFEILYDSEGNVRPQVNESFKFQGEIDTTEFSSREINLIEKGKVSLEMSIDDERFGPYNNTRIIQIKNGQYALEMIGGAQTATDAQHIAEQKAFNILDTFGMEGNTHKHLITNPLEGTDGYMSKVYIPLSESQAKFIGATYTNLGMAIGNQ